MRLIGQRVILRQPAAADDGFILSCENNRENWAFSQRTEVLSASDLREFRNNTRDFFSDGQLRLLITLHDNRRAGIVDLFAYLPGERRAEVGILVFPEELRRLGLASESLNLLCQYAFGVLRLSALQARVQQDNHASRMLFMKSGFEPATIKDSQPIIQLQKLPS